MFNPVSYICNSIKTTPVESKVFEYTNLIPVIGLIVQISKHLSLRSEVHQIEFNEGDDYAKIQSFNQAVELGKSILRLDQINHKWQFADTLTLVSGVAFFTLFPPVGSGLIVAGLLLSFSRLAISHKFVPFMVREIESHRPERSFAFRFVHPS